ncbi:MAG: SRPBCC domain-containing protein [Pseudomonadota bacterium]
MPVKLMKKAKAERINVKGESRMNIHKTYELAFPIEHVYAAWVSSNTVIPPATSMDILPEIGGHYRLFIEMPDMKSSNEGKFLIIEPNRHIRYTWEWNNDGNVTEIDVVFIPIQQGTRIVLKHSGFTDQQSMAMHDAGWDSYVEGFTNYLADV